MLWKRPSLPRPSFSNQITPRRKTSSFAVHGHTHDLCALHGVRDAHHAYRFGQGGNVGHSLDTGVAAAPDAEVHLDNFQSDPVRVRLSYPVRHGLAKPHGSSGNNQFQLHVVRTSADQHWRIRDISCFPAPSWVSAVATLQCQHQVTKSWLTHKRTIECNPITSNAEMCFTSGTSLGCPNLDIGSKLAAVGMWKSKRDSRHIRWSGEIVYQRRAIDCNGTFA